MAYRLLTVVPIGQRTQPGLEAGKQACGCLLPFTADLQRRGELEGPQRLEPEEFGPSQASERVRGLTIGGR